VARRSLDVAVLQIPYVLKKLSPPLSGVNSGYFLMNFLIGNSCRIGVSCGMMILAFQ
jgi:hypothetical protein